MIDNFSLLMSHGLVLIACWRLLRRDDLDQEMSARDEASASAAAMDAEPPKATPSWRKAR